MMVLGSYNHHYSNQGCQFENTFEQTSCIYSHLELSISMFRIFHLPGQLCGIIYLASLEGGVWCMYAAANTKNTCMIDNFCSVMQ